MEVPPIWAIDPITPLVLTLTPAQDSLLAAPIMLDLVLLTELCQRVTFCTELDPEPQGFHSVLSLLSFLFKAPLAPPGSPVINALFRQRSCIENILRWVLSPPLPCHPGLSQAGEGGMEHRPCIACQTQDTTGCAGPQSDRPCPDPAARAWGSHRRTTCSWSTRWSGQ